MFEYIGDEARLIRLGARPRDRFRLVAMAARHHLAARRIAFPGAARHADLRLDGLELRVRANDYFVLLEILSLGAYDIDFAPLGAVATVLDVGANMGLATIFLSRRLAPGTSFVCVEPSPDSFALLERNLGRNVPRARAIHAAATGEPTTVTVTEGANPALSSIRHEDVGAAGIQVPGMTIAGILDASGLARVDLVKLDVEGAEGELFDGADAWSHRVAAVLAEIHPPLTVEAAAAQLAARGYRRLPLPPGPKFARLVLALK